MAAILITSILLLLYSLVLFPVILLVVAARKREAEWKIPNDADLPSMELFISARNEQAAIAKKIENSLQLRYPRDRLQVTVLANGCTDGTVEIGRRYEDRGVRVYEYGEIGKTEAQNRGVDDSQAEILAFTDANTLFEVDALVRLVAPFADDTIGAVSGRHRYRNNGRASEATESAYWNIFETVLKRAESATGGLIGANGSIYALRREHYIPLPSDVISDLMEPLLIAAKGFRTVYVVDAVAWETAEEEFKAELARKERIVRRSVASLFKYPELLNPLRHGRLACLLWSHKVLRWLSPFLVGMVLVGSTLRILIGRGRTADLFLFGGSSIAGFFALLGRGLGTEKPIPLLSHAYYIFLMLRAAFKGVYRAIAYGSQTTWNHTR
ncbi:MAG: glycosyltransferase [bacterium]